jgi:hypothetical protein
VLQLTAAALVWFFAPPGPLSEDTICHERNAQPALDCA